MGNAGRGAGIPTCVSRGSDRLERGVHLLENGGHWAAMTSLAVTGVAAVLLLRAPAYSNVE